MGEPDPPNTAANAAPDRLDSWKEIAAFFGRGVTTVQRWEEDEELPVHRHGHAKRGTVYAFKAELARWQAGRSLTPTPAETVAEVTADSSEAPPPTATPHLLPQLPDVEHVTPGHARGILPWYALSPKVLGVLAALAIGGLGIRAMTSTRATIVPDSSVSRPLANDDAYEAYPTLSPDGTLVAYRWSRAEAPGLYIKRTSGGASWALEVDGSPTDVRRDSFPKWSPDGHSIAFLRERGSSVWDVRVVSSSGGTSRRVTQITSGSVSWMPDNATLAVSDRAASGEPYSVYLVSIADGRRLRRITSPPLGTLGDWHCSISPDGTQLAVARFRSGYEADIYLTTLTDGESGLKRITHDSVGLGHLEWTPDGRSLVFASQRAERAAVWEIATNPAPGELPRLVAGAEGGAQHPTLARTFEGDGLKLAFQYERSTVAIWRWDLGATPQPAPRAIARTEISSDRQPSWSPDGTRMAFSSARSGELELWMSNADGGSAHQVTLHSGLGVLQPRWSPQGGWILFTATRGGQQDIYKVREDGTDVTRVTYDPADERNGTWSRDGHWIYFRSSRQGSVRVWKTEADHRVEPVPATTSESSEGIESLDGTTLYFTKHDDAGLWQKALPAGAETLLVPDWHAREGFWDVIRDGILMIDKQVQGSQVNQPLTLFEFASGRLVPFATLPVIVARTQDGISARPDGALLWSQEELHFSDLMLFEHWRPRSTP